MSNTHPTQASYPSFESAQNFACIQRFTFFMKCTGLPYRGLLACGQGSADQRDSTVFLTFKPG